MHRNIEYIERKYYYLRGIQIKSGLPIKNGSHIHLFVFLSQVAPTPQTIPSHLSLQRPPIQMLGSTHGLAAEQTSGTHCPPGNGLPMKPSIHLQVGPATVAIHCAPRPQTKPSHTITNMDM